MKCLNVLLGDEKKKVFTGGKRIILAPDEEDTESQIKKSKIKTGRMI